MPSIKTLLVKSSDAKIGTVISRRSGTEYNVQIGRGSITATSVLESSLRSGNVVVVVPTEEGMRIIGLDSPRLKTQSVVYVEG